MRGRSFTIGLLLDNIRNPFYGDFLDGVTDALAKTDFQVLVGSAGFSAENQSRVADAMIDRAMDGHILIAPSMSRIRADLSLVGYDNTTLAASAPINLTSVDQAAHDLGRTAARLLGERMDSRGRSILTSTAPQLIVRNTTAPPPS